jgi:Secretion system C-terminal sorting domain
VYTLNLIFSPHITSVYRLPALGLQFLKSNIIMKPVILTVFFLSVLSSRTFSQFSGMYAPSKWATVLSANSTGSVNSTLAPVSVMIIGSDDPTNTFGGTTDVDYRITIGSAGILSFAWSYHSNDVDHDPMYDPAGVVINGVFTQLTVNTSGLVNQTGTYTSVSLAAGTVIGFRVRATDNGYGDARLTISGFSAPSGVLPVNFGSFTVQKEGTTNRLKWTTASESGSDHFEVERSTDGNVFTTLSSLPAHGNSSEELSYSFVDNNPQAGANFYRIREVDIDGHFLYSKVVTINFDIAAKASAFPNPATAKITITANTAGWNMPVMVRLYSSSGYLIGSRTWSTQGSTSMKVDWDVAALKPGVYFFTIGEEKIRLSFVKR